MLQSLGEGAVDTEPEPVAGRRVTPETLGLLLDFVHHNMPLGAALETRRRNVVVRPWIQMRV